MHYAIGALLCVAGVIHLLPLAGLFSADSFQRLYGIAVTNAGTNTDLLILLRHRAILFGILACFLLAAVFLPQWRWAAIAAGLVSTVSFVLLAALSGGYGDAIARVVAVDWVAIASLLVAAFLCWLQTAK